MSVNNVIGRRAAGRPRVPGRSRPGSMAAGWLLAALGVACTPGGQELRVPAGAGAMLPRLTGGETPLLSWVEPAGTGHRLMFAEFGGNDWGMAREVAAGSDWFVNWADFPSVERLGDGRLAAHWLQKEGTAPYAYGVRISQTDNDGSWSPAVTPHDDGTPTEHGFVSLFPVGTALGAVWLDGRNMAADPPGGMTLRAARIRPDGRISAAWEIDALTCDCCQTGAAAGPMGAVVVYRDRSEHEVRDIYASVLGPEGWSSPARVAADGWRIDGCPVNGPAVAASGSLVVTGWFTAADGSARVRAAVSRNGGYRFEQAMDLSEGPVLGRVDVAALPGGRAAVSWVAAGHGKADGSSGARLRYRVIGASGPGPVQDVAYLEGSRAAGFPQMAATADRLIFAWTETGAGGPGIRSLAVRLP